MFVLPSALKMRQNAIQCQNIVPEIVEFFLVNKPNPAEDYTVEKKFTKL